MTLTPFQRGFLLGAFVVWALSMAFFTLYQPREGWQSPICAPLP